MLDDRTLWTGARLRRAATAFLGGAMLLFGALAPVRAADLPKVIFDNDMTNWDAAPSDPGARPAPVPQVVEQVQSAFDKSLAMGAIPGVDAQSLSVHYSVFPWWWQHSTLYTLADHDRFLRSLRYFADPASPTGYPGPFPSRSRAYQQSGHDLIADFMNYRGAGGPSQTKILSFRLNDYHYNWNYDLYRSKTRDEVLEAIGHGQSPLCDGKSIKTALSAEYWSQTAFTAYFDAFSTGRLDPALDGRCVGSTCVSRAEFQQQCGDGSCVLRTATKQCAIVNLNFAKPLVRKFVLMQMSEVVKAYHPPLFEVDVDRFPRDFAPNVSTPERIRTMTAWYGEMHTALTAIEPGLKVGLRVPAKAMHRASLGVDLKALDAAHAIDFAILAMPYIADQQIDYDLDPATAHMKLYAEMTHSTGSPSPPPEIRGDLASNGAPLRNRELTTPSELLTAANLAYHHGAYGIALFNMQYYADVDSAADAVKLPTAAVTCLAQPACAARSDQTYFLTAVHYNLPPTPDMLPFRVDAARPHAFALDMAPPARGWSSKGGTLRLTAVPGRGAGPQDRPALTVTINGVKLEALAAAPAAEAAVQSDLAAYNRSLWFAQPRFNADFQVPASAIHSGSNRIEIGDGSAEPLTILDFKLSIGGA